MYLTAICQLLSGTNAPRNPLSWSDKMQPPPVLEVLTYRLTPSLTAPDYLAIVRQTAPAIAWTFSISL
mgnify:CR=1 FL=1